MHAVVHKGDERCKSVAPPKSRVRLYSPAAFFSRSGVKVPNAIRLAGK
jgi:hypothetical protein